MLRKQSVVFFVGFALIIGIIAFYATQYFRDDRTPLVSAPTKSHAPVTDDMFIPYSTATEKILTNRDKTIIIDVRLPELFAQRHIPHSTNVPIDSIGALTLHDGFDFIIITSSGDEKGFGVEAVQILRGKNEKLPIAILQGGFESWKDAGGPTISFGDPSDIVDQSKVNYIAPEDLKKSLDAKQPLIILDMRPKNEYDQGHVPGAANLPLDQLESRYDKLPSAVKIVAYGGSQLEDFQAGVRLSDLNFFGVRILKGGFAAWKDKGFEAQK